ncbi:outer membrane beta-barrel protein [Spirosoma sp. SC4-14]|uniref:outer membrane beta-barrel protein n=1 Tax=Spirosoma sp. SC4-14 TaxID=3128900 RepID=UPI0030D35E8D
MKQLIVSLLFFCLVAQYVQAQNIVKRWGIGVLGGVNRTMPLWTSNSSTAYDPAYQPIVGLDIQYRLNRHASLHLQPSYTRVNDQRSQANNWSNIISTYSLSSLKLPVLYRYRLFGSGTTPFFELGVGYNRAINGNGLVDSRYICDLIACPNDPMFYQQYSLTGKSAVSAIAGVGVNIELQKISIPIVLRYERYLSGHTFTSDYNANSSNLKVDGFMLLTGINF